MANRRNVTSLSYGLLVLIVLNLKGAAETEFLSSISL